MVSVAGTQHEEGSDGHERGRPARHKRPHPNSQEATACLNLWNMKFYTVMDFPS